MGLFHFAALFYYDLVSCLQRVYGVTTATVKVGYEYEDCDTVWSIQTTRLAGHDMTSSDLNGWNIDVQHKYNYHAGILQKGDGSTVYLKYKPQASFFIRHECKLHIRPFFANQNSIFSPKTQAKCCQNSSNNFRILNFSEIYAPI